MFFQVDTGRIVRRFDKHHTNIQLTFREQPGSTCSYSPEEHTIYLSIQGLKREFWRLRIMGYRKLDIYDLAEVILLHEIGHAMDPNLLKIRRKINEAKLQFNHAIDRLDVGHIINSNDNIIYYSLRAEQTAWNNAEKLTKNTILLSLMRRIAGYFIRSYEDYYQNHLTKILSLVAV